MSRPYITVVTGMPRSGTSMVMQMLCAGEGGIPPYDPTTSRWPAFEADDAKHLPQSNEWVLDAYGRVVKVLEPLHFRLPHGPAYRFVVMMRSAKEQARSSFKFLCVFDPSIVANREARKTLQKSLERDLIATIDALNDYPNSCVIPVRFENVIRDPVAAATRLAEFLGPLDVAAMAAEVRKRPTHCLPYMLETRMLAEEDAT